MRVLLLALAPLSLARVGTDRSLLKCKYSQKKGTNAGGDFGLDSVICPEGQDRYCIKQVAEGLDRNECGATEYFGDEFDDVEKECIFRKCASECSEDTQLVHSELIEAFREAKTYKRRTFCCQTDYCNAGAATRAGAWTWLLLAATAAALLLR
ncbi:hypothetical protein M885DRAFT_551370 [Pelagophyceae sp. CCMP2097]|nr:hypothetical protein M885DRAFT_551370 [Pelagophyceae sp. CCMP2097]